MLEILILAAVQGLTEFLPISSSGHLILIPKILGIKDFGLALDAFLHLGTLLAVLVYFRKDIWLMLKALFIRSEAKFSKLGYGILLANIPVICFGFFCKQFFESDFIRSIDFIAYTLIAGSILMFIADKLFSNNQKSILDLSYLQMFFIGLMQCLALMPGISRSGSTISGSMMMGLKRDEAAKFGFLLGLPAIAGAGLLAIKDFVESPNINLNLESLGLGFIISFIAGYFAIDFLIKFLKQQSLIYFVIYRLVLALILILIY